MNSIHINKILGKLQPPRELINYEIIEHHREGEERYICIVETNTNEKLVIKYYMNSYNTIQQVAGWAKLVDLYKSHSLRVPKFHKFYHNEYAIEELIQENVFLIWVEEFLQDSVLDEEDKLKNMTEEFYEELGSVLGIMHSASKNEAFRFSWNSPWVIFDKFCADDLYDENYEHAHALYSELKALPIDHDRLNSVWEKYNLKRKLIEKCYANLPNGAVQGDLSVNNIVMDNNYRLKGVLDFNIAGNDVFVNHVMQEGIFLSFISDTFWNTEDELCVMANKFSRFMTGYSTNYELSKEELGIVDLLYQIIRPFRMEKVYTTIKEAKKGNYEEVNKRLKWMESELGRMIYSDLFTQ